MSMLFLERGDITNFPYATAIVNAGNETLCGCFTPNHKCLDHQIHKKAGPALYQACKRIMAGRIVLPGEVIITSGYNLPSKLIIHAYGLNCNILGKRPDLLEATYINCLRAASANDVDSIAFPTISTGLYGYPKSEAASIAFRTVQKWLQNNFSRIKKVFFVTYSDEDHNAYRPFFDV